MKPTTKNGNPKSPLLDTATAIDLYIVEITTEKWQEILSVTSEDTAKQKIQMFLEQQGIYPATLFRVRLIHVFTRGSTYTTYQRACYTREKIGYDINVTLNSVEVECPLSFCDIAPLGEKQ